MTAAAVLACAVLGAAVGGVLNVVVWRVRSGEPLPLPGPRGGRWERPQRAGGATPVLSRVLSRVLLRGGWRAGDTRTSLRGRLVELGTAALFALVAWRLGPTAALPAFLYLTAVGVALAVIDADTRRLPDVLTLPSYAVGGVLLGVAAAVEGDPSRLLRAGQGMTVLYAGYFAVCWLTAGRGLGFGDVKLAGMFGLYLGWLGWPELLLGVLAAHLLAGAVATGLLLRGRAARGTRVPFGPFLIAGALLSVLLSPAAAWLQTA